MCGVVGIVGESDIIQNIYDSLLILQHRGQDSAGIVTCEEHKIHIRKRNGLVRDVFRQNHMLKLKGNMGIGHVRYPTAGSNSNEEAQPFYVNSPYGIALVHNGNLTNVDNLRIELLNEDKRHILTPSDSEVLLNVFASELRKRSSQTLTNKIIFESVEEIFTRCHGAYSVVLTIPNFGIVAFRDPYGIRPLVLGQKLNSRFCVVASESVVLNSLGCDMMRDIEPGEIVIIDKHGFIHEKKPTTKIDHTPCLFEWVYLARPDSVIEDVSVYDARFKMGVNLGKKILSDWPENDIDVVIPIPDTSRVSALSLSETIGVKYREGFIKNRYIGRTFIMPTQNERIESVRRKLNPIPSEFKGKNVLLVDDSIVRGTTSKKIVQMAREAGAAKVYFASASPPIRFINVYGIDMPAEGDLIAHNHTIDEIEILLNVDKLIYQDLSGLKSSIISLNPDLVNFETSIFNGQYMTPGISEEFLEYNRKKRGGK